MLDATSRVADDGRTYYDLAIRISRMPGSTLVSRKLTSTRMMLCASETYLKKHGVPQRPADLAAWAAGRAVRPLAQQPPTLATQSPWPHRVCTMQVMTKYGIEWDRRLSTTLGVANNRLYELRLQSASTAFEGGRGGVVEAVQRSFRVREVEA